MNIKSFLRQMREQFCNVTKMQEDRDAQLAQAQTDIEMLRISLEKAAEGKKIAGQAAFDMGAQFATLSEKFLEERTARDDAELRLCRVRKMAMVAWFDGTMIQPGLLRDLIS